MKTTYANEQNGMSAIINETCHGKEWFVKVVVSRNGETSELLAPKPYYTFEQALSYARMVVDGFANHTLFPNLAHR